MSERTPWMAAVAREVLKGAGSLPWAAFVQATLSVETMRELCLEHGLAPKGGFRLEKAPAKILAPLLAEQREAPIIEAVAAACQAALRHDGSESVADRDVPPPPPPVASPWKGRAERAQAEVEAARVDAQRERSGAARQRQRADDLAHRVQGLEEELIRRQSQVAALQRQLEQRSAAPSAAPPRADLTRLRELERDFEALEVAEAGLRRRLSFARTRERELEDQVAELEALVPKGRRRRRAVVEPPAPTKRLVVPYLLPSFYKSLEAKERRSVERALQALLLFATEGPAYPGLEVKQLGGQDLWSMRASLKLRIYFRMRTDGDVDVLALADREDQETMLRRLKET